MSVAWLFRVQVVFFFFFCFVLFFFLRYFSGIVSYPKALQVSQYVSVESSSRTRHRPYSLFVCSIVD